MSEIVYTVCLVIIFVMLCLHVINAIAGRTVFNVPGVMELVFALIALALFLPRLHG